MGDLTEQHTEQQPQHGKPKDTNMESIPKLPWWKALRRASNESNKSANHNKHHHHSSTNNNNPHSPRPPPPPVSEICIPTHCLTNVSESPQDYLDRQLKLRGYSTQRTPVDPNFSDTLHQGRNEAHQAMADNQWKAVHTLLSSSRGDGTGGPQLLLQTDHTGRTPLMYVEPEDWMVWLQFLDASILDRHWPDPTRLHHEDEDSEDSDVDHDYSDVGSVGSAIQQRTRGDLVVQLEDSLTSLNEQDPCATVDDTEKGRMLRQEELKNLEDVQLTQKCFQAALEARG